MSRDIPIELIDPDPEQPRRHFDPQALEELAQSLATQGQIVPITVRPVDERFVIVQGERRYRAAKLAGLQVLRAEAVEMDADAAFWLALTENVQRADLTPLEEARAFQRLLDRGITQTALAKRLGKSQSYVAQKIRLLKMPGPLQVFLEHGVLTEGHMRQILRLQGIYGDDTTRWGIEERIVRAWAEGDLSGGGSFDERIAVAAFTVTVRPVDALWGVGYPPPERITPYRDAMVAYGRYSLAHDCQPPSWVTAAMWFAMSAAAQEASVVDLHTLVDHFEHLLYSNVVMLNSYTGLKQRGRDAGNLLYFSALSDLRHAGIPVVEGKPPRELWLRAVKFICNDKMYEYLLPSQFQPGGHHAELGVEMARRAQEGLEEEYVT